MKAPQQFVPEAKATTCLFPCRTEVKQKLELPGIALLHQFSALSRGGQKSAAKCQMAGGRRQQPLRGCAELMWPPASDSRGLSVAHQLGYQAEGGLFLETGNLDKVPWSVVWWHNEDVRTHFYGVENGGVVMLQILFKTGSLCPSAA
jgi:hypothetical protein